MNLTALQRRKSRVCPRHTEKADLAQGGGTKPGGITPASDALKAAL